jgi:site-specific recombinase XerD
MARTNKDYKVGTYTVKTPRPKTSGPMCPTCSKCLDKDFCKHRKSIAQMKKCSICNNCADSMNCDKFYISLQHSITIPIGIDEATGEIIRKKFSGKTQNEAIFRSEQFKKEHPGGITQKLHRVIPQTIEVITQDFINMKNNSGIDNDSTFKSYTDILARIKRNSGEWFNKPISQIKRNEIEDFLSKERNLNYSDSTLKKDYAMLKTAFSIAKMKKYIQDSFFDGYYGIIRPHSKKKPNKVKSFKSDEFSKLLKYLYNTNNKISHRDVYLLAIHYGVRIGEILGLEISDIDFEKGIVHIRRTTTSNKLGKVILGNRTKTPSGERDLPMNELTRPILMHAVKNAMPNKYNLLFCNPEGNVYTDGALNSCLKRICFKAGITSNAHNHKLRHSFTTNGVESGIDYKVMEETLGHSDIRITLDTYTDAQKEFQEKELQKYVNRVKLEFGNLSNIYSEENNAEITTVPE